MNQVSSSMSGIGAADTVKSVLRFLASHGAYITTTRAQKLLYLIERQCILDTGNRCLNLEYKHDRYGMYSPTLNNVLLGLSPKKDQLEVMRIVTHRGQGRTIKSVGERVEELLPEHLERAIVKVLSRWGFLDTPALIDAAKRTSPFVYAKKGEYVDWNVLLEERCKDDEELSDEGRYRLEIAEESLRLGRRRDFENVDELIADLFSE